LEEEANAEMKDKQNEAVEDRMGQMKGKEKLREKN
jgi:hypothetical protein